ncbi:MAG TPA: sigma-70 family RNA polymerase sigma factor [Rudaea sp.]|nr:sigma-70 family RNA polymerase sigma factor [Rudaea sp.]
MSQFQTTQWSMVLNAGNEPGQARHALESLCRMYRPPVLAYILGHHYTAESAEDLTQTFFARFIEQGYYLKADPLRGSFRAFLLTALKRFLNDVLDQEKTIKRGGLTQLRSLDTMVSGDYALRDRETPELAFHRAWAHTVVKDALRTLREEAQSAGKTELFGELSVFIAERPDDADYERVAAKFGMRRNTIAVAVHRLRQRLRELIRNQLAQTAADNDELEHELDELGQSISLFVS